MNFVELVSPKALSDWQAFQFHSSGEIAVTDK